MNTATKEQLPKRLTRIEQADKTNASMAAVARLMRPRVAHEDHDYGGAPET